MFGSTTYFFIHQEQSLVSLSGTSLILSDLLFIDPVRASLIFLPAFSKLNTICGIGLLCLNYCQVVLCEIMRTPFTIVARIRSFKFAFRGIWILFKTQHNAWIHFSAAIIVIFLNIYFHVSPTEWCLLILTITIVLAAEAFNSAIEFLADATTAEFHPLIEKSKDTAAGAVLLTAIGAFIIGCFIFLPYFKTLLFS